MTKTKTELSFEALAWFLDHCIYWISREEEQRIIDVMRVCAGQGGAESSWDGPELPRHKDVIELTPSDFEVDDGNRWGACERLKAISAGFQYLTEERQAEVRPVIGKLAAAVVADLVGSMGTEGASRA